jgi:hypothetical protein
MGETARAFAMCIGGDGRSGERSRGFIAGGSGANRAGSEISRRLESEPPRHAETDECRALWLADCLLMRTMERPEQRYAFPMRRCSQLLIQRRKRQPAFLRES